MSLISAIDVSFQAGAKHLFENLSFHINHNDKIGLVGHNGCGKSTLIRLITGDETVDSGRLFTQRGLRVGLVEQFSTSEFEMLLVFDAVAASLPEEQRLIEAYRVDALLSQLGFEADIHQRRVNQLSGGQKNLVLFARAVIQEPELLLLDEPGNHMDSKAMFYLKRYLGQTDVPAFLMISHDRDLLDSVTDRTLWLRDERCYSFAMAYSHARLALQEHDADAKKTRELEEKEISQLKVSAKRLATWGKDYDNEKLARKAKTMEKRIGKLEAAVTFVSRGSGLALSVDVELLRAKQLFVMEDEHILSPGKQPLFSVEEMVFRPGDRVALLGVNGAGKSSCIEALLSHFRKDIGQQSSTRFNPNVRIGYFDQELAEFNCSTGIIDWVRNHSGASDDVVKRTLIAWGFPYAEHNRRVNVLSGGERARLLLMTFQLDQPNLLVMDEPTNHIDLQGKEELEQDLVMPGISLLFTSHDQRFIENIATRFWWIHDGQLEEISYPEPFFANMWHSGSPGDPTPGGLETEARPRPVEAAGEEQLLTRIYELETLIEQDQTRKPKFQKPVKQEEWKLELATLLGKLDS